ncbi:MAG: hypothetical protein ABI440_09075 [Casimicrobiaceae bacterium]
MAHTRAQAAKLLNRSELELFAESRADVVKTLTAARLRGKIRRTRNLRDKFQDLFKRQRLATRARTGSKVGTSGVANQRTDQKLELFADMLQRFEKRLAQLAAAEAAAAKKKAAAQRKRVLMSKRRAVAARSSGKGLKADVVPRGGTSGAPYHADESARRAQTAMRFKVAGQQSIRGHVSAKGRRNQAKRDNLK